MDLDFVSQFIIILLLICTFLGRDRPVFRDTVYPALLYVLIFCYSIQTVISLRDKSDIVDFCSSVLFVLVAFGAIRAVSSIVRRFRGSTTR